MTGSKIASRSEYLVVPSPLPYCPPYCSLTVLRCSLPHSLHCSERCRYPLPDGETGREVPPSGRNQSILGVVFDASGYYEYGIRLLANTTFASFDNSCRLAAAVAVGYTRGIYWNTGNALQTLRFATGSKANKVYLFPGSFMDANNQSFYTGGPAQNYALRDLDGSILGGKGYIVANNTDILPPSSFSPACTALAGANAYGCRNTCYRTVQVHYSSCTLQSPTSLQRPTLL